MTRPSFLRHHQQREPAQPQAIQFVPLRAYMAGILLPTWFVFVVVIVGLGGIEVELEAPPIMFIIIMFAMAMVPNLWGMWNMLYFRAGVKRRLPLSVWGALLGLLMIPIDASLLQALQVHVLTPKLVLEVAPVVMGVYFLAWKFVVAFFNRVVGLD